MLMTLPGLKADSEESGVGPDVIFADDGLDGVFTKAFIRDEYPWMDLKHEVRDLMVLVEPTLAELADVSIDEQYIPDDDIIVDWEEETHVESPESTSCVEAIPEIVADSAEEIECGTTDDVKMISAPVKLMLPSPTYVEEESEQGSDDGSAEAPCEDIRTVADQPHSVWKVCFSF